MTTVDVRFWAKVDKTETCWLWTAARDPAGYGRFSLSGVNRQAHRVAWLLVRGVEAAQDLDHLCRVRHCVRPDHLEDVSSRENILRGEGACAQHARKTHCPQGHPYEGANLYMYPDGRHRGCRTCNRERVYVDQL